MYTVVQMYIYLEQPHICSKLCERHKYRLHLDIVYGFGISVDTVFYQVLKLGLKKNSVNSTKFY